MQGGLSLSPPVAVTVTPQLCHCHPLALLLVLPGLHITSTSWRSGTEMEIFVPSGKTWKRIEVPMTPGPTPVP